MSKAEVVAAGSDSGIESNRQVVESPFEIEKWEAEVVKKLDQVVGDEIFRSQHPELKSQVDDKLKRIKEDVRNLTSFISTASQMQPPDDGDRQILEQEWAYDETFKNEGITELENIFNCSEKILDLPEIRNHLLCLAVFPEEMAIKKRLLIYWWIGEGLLTTEEAGEQVLQELLKKRFIRPTTTTSFMVYPWIRKYLETKTDELWASLSRSLKFAFLYGDEKKQESDLVTAVNVTEKYLGTRQDGPWGLLSKSKKLKVLQLGRWQDSATHHIEVEDYKTLLDSVASHKHLQYLSLRGISRIETLTGSMWKLTALQILDLRACHNLERLPQGISKLKKLTHLDVSECYLLDSMPKGLEGLSLLQVLKGFVVSNPSRNSCKISDLERLKDLRKLSIRVAIQGKDQSLMLANFRALRILTISWGFVSPNITTVVSFPTGLIKLDLRLVPFEEVPNWLKPTALPPSLKLYIKGGKLKDLDHHRYPNLKCFRVSYLKQLKSHQQEIN